MSVDIQVITTPDPSRIRPTYRGSTSNPRSNALSAAISRYALASITYRPAFARSVAGCSGFSMNETIRPTASSWAIPQLRGFGAEQNHGKRVFVGAMEFEQRTEIDIAEIIGIDDHDLVGKVGKVGIGGDCAG